MKTQEQKKTEALMRQQAHDARTVEEQLNLTKTRRGQSRKERARLEAKAKEKGKEKGKEKDHGDKATRSVAV